MIFVFFAVFYTSLAIEILDTASEWKDAGYRNSDYVKHLMLYMNLSCTEKWIECGFDLAEIKTLNKLMDVSEAEEWKIFG